MFSSEKVNRYLFLDAHTYFLSSSNYASHDAPLLHLETELLRENYRVSSSILKWNTNTFFREKENEDFLKLI